MSAVTMQTAAFAPSQAGAAPQILNAIGGGDEVVEGDPIHLELRVAPPGDLQVQWFKDGHPLNAGSRFNTSFERGLISLDIIYTFPEDSGLYYCVIANNFGTVQSEPVAVKILAELEPDQDQIDAQWAATYETTSTPSREYERDQRNKPTSVPQFTNQPVISSSDVLEGDAIRIEAALIPTSDSTLRVEWMKDLTAIGTGSRFNAIVDRGLVVLEIACCLAEDSGTYTCVASNIMGSTESQPVQLCCTPEDRIVTKSILDENSINHLRQFDEPGEEFSHYSNEVIQAMPPSFTGNIEPESIQVTEDEPVIFTVPVNCGNGDRLVVEWRRDNDIVITGSRITGKLEMGIATLKIHYTQPIDNGTYTCHVATEHGSAKSAPATLICEASGIIIAASQLPGDREKSLQAIETLEAILHAPRGTAYEEDGPVDAPHFVRDLESMEELEEGMTAHFEVFFEPLSDPTLSVCWFKDNDCLSSGTRFHVTNDRGIATLDLIYTIHEDSGDYWCRLQNGSGQVDSNHVTLNCHPGISVITQSNLLQGSEGYNLIKAIEAVEPVEGEFNYQEEEEPDCAPNFDVKPQAVTIGEGSPVRFLVRVSGKPTPVVTWYLNGETVKQDSITKVFSDGAINYLEMSRCPALQGSNQLQVTAQNELGETEAEAVLTVVLTEDFRPDLKHVKPENPFRKMMGLRKVDCSPELNKALMRTKPSAKTIMEMERGTEMKARMFRSPEVLEAEKMLDQLTMNLRKSEVKRPPIANAANHLNSHEQEPV